MERAGVAAVGPTRGHCFALHIRCDDTPLGTSLQLLVEPEFLFDQRRGLGFRAPARMATIRLRRGGGGRVAASRRRHTHRRADPGPAGRAGYRRPAVRSTERAPRRRPARWCSRHRVSALQQQSVCNSRVTPLSSVSGRTWARARSRQSLLKIMQPDQLPFRAESCAPHRRGWKPAPEPRLGA